MSERKVRRFGLVIKAKPNKIKQYQKLHSNNVLGVRKLLRKYHITNFSIFKVKITKTIILFGYFEYTGNSYKKDMLKMNKEPEIIKWLSICDPCQIPLKGHETWAEMVSIYSVSYTHLTLPTTPYV